jgi:hypothetical protein
MKKPQREHPIVKELNEYWTEAFHQFAMNPKDTESESFYHLAKTAAQFAFTLEALRILTKDLKMDHMSQHIERELNTAYHSLKGSNFTEYKFEEGEKWKRQK